MKIINKELDMLIERLSKASDTQGSSEFRLRKVFDTYVGFYKEYSGLIGKFLGKGENSKTNLRISDLIAGLKSRADERYQIVSSILNDGILHNEFISFDVEKTAKIFLSLMIGLITATEADQITELEAYEEPVFALFMNGIKKIKEGDI